MSELTEEEKQANEERAMKILGSIKRDAMTDNFKSIEEYLKFLVKQNNDVIDSLRQVNFKLDRIERK